MNIDVYSGKENKKTRKAKLIKEVSDDLVDLKMDEDWNLLWEDVEKNVFKLRNDLKYFWLDLDCIKIDE